jgi:hypothetical protein
VGLINLLAALSEVDLVFQSAKSAIMENIQLMTSLFALDVSSSTFQGKGVKILFTTSKLYMLLTVPN